MSTDRDELRRQQRPVCPHCGHEHNDAWEWNFGPGIEGESEGRQCYVCDGFFDCERVVDVSYTTRAAPQATEAQQEQRTPQSEAPK